MGKRGPAKERSEPIGIRLPTGLLYLLEKSCELIGPDHTMMAEIERRLWDSFLEKKAPRNISVPRLRNCETCGEEFAVGKNGARITAKFCSDRCRLIAHRKKREVLPSNVGDRAPVAAQERSAQTIGKAALAKYLGWSRPTLDKRIDEDPRFPVRSRGNQGGGWTFDVGDVEAYLRGGEDKPHKEVTLPENKKTLSVPEAGQIYFGLSKNGSYEAAHRGEIPTVRIGRLLRVPIVALERKLSEVKPATTSI